MNRYKSIYHFSFKTGNLQKPNGILVCKRHKVCWRVNMQFVPLFLQPIDLKGLKVQRKLISSNSMNGNMLLDKLWSFFYTYNRERDYKRYLCLLSICFEVVGIHLFIQLFTGQVIITHLYNTSLLNYNALYIKTLCTEIKLGTLCT